MLFLPLAGKFLSPSLISVFFFSFFKFMFVWFWFHFCSYKGCLIFLIYVSFSILFILFPWFWYVGGCELNGFGVEIDCEHHMFVNMHQREIEKQIYLNFLNCMIFWGFKGIGLFGILVICWWGSRMLLWNMSWKGNMGLFCSEDPRYLVPANTINIREVSVSQCNCRYPSYWEG